MVGGSAGEVLAGGVGLLRSRCHRRAARRGRRRSSRVDGHAGRTMVSRCEYQLRRSGLPARRCSRRRQPDGGRGRRRGWGAKVVDLEPIARAIGGVRTDTSRARRRCRGCGGGVSARRSRGAGRISGYRCGRCDLVGLRSGLRALGRCGPTGPARTRRAGDSRRLPLQRQGDRQGARQCRTGRSSRGAARTHRRRRSVTPTRSRHRGACLRRRDRPQRILTAGIGSGRRGRH